MSRFRYPVLAFAVSALALGPAASAFALPPADTTTTVTTGTNTTVDPGTTVYIKWTGISVPGNAKENLKQYTGADCAASAALVNALNSYGFSKDADAEMSDGMSHGCVYVGHAS